VNSASFSGVRNGLVTSVAIKCALGGKRETSGAAKTAQSLFANGTSASNTKTTNAVALRNRERS
jgi:hypothetical protein